MKPKNVCNPEPSSDLRPDSSERRQQTETVRNKKNNLRSNLSSPELLNSPFVHIFPQISTRVLESFDSLSGNFPASCVETWLQVSHETFGQLLALFVATKLDISAERRDIFQPFS